MKRVLQGLLIGTALLVLSARPAAAQTFSGGYALVDWGGCCAHGFAVDFAHPLHKMNGMMGMNIAAVADFGWTHFSAIDVDAAESDTTFGGGARVNFLTETRYPVFGQVTFGVLHWHEDAFDIFPEASGNDFAMAFGFGTIIKATDTIGIKPQADFFVLPNNDDWFFRFSVNAVFHLGKK